MSNSKKYNVCKEIVANDLCIGCGVCAAVCPHSHLKIVFNDLGRYVASEHGDKCPDSCNLCFDVCPFVSGAENEDTLGESLFATVSGISHTSETGYHLGSFAGFSKVDGHRENGASGGMATWILESLLDRGIVDKVACVSPVRNGEALFNYNLCDDTNKIRTCSKSCYYPVEASKVLRHVLSEDHRYAIIALPCVCKAIRKAMKIYPKLRDRILYVLGLTCGQTKSKFFAEYICALGKGDPNNIKNFIFRVKDDSRPAADFGMSFESADANSHTETGTVFWSEGISEIWANRYFTPNPCNFCDDVFAELADVCFLDAWLPGYKSDPKGHNIVLVRNEFLGKLCKDAAKNGNIEVIDMDISEVIKSQASVLQAKRQEMAQRLKLARKKGSTVPLKREHLCIGRLTLVQKFLVRLRYTISLKSPGMWRTSKKHLPTFKNRFRSYSMCLSLAKQGLRIERIFTRLLSICHKT